MSEGISYAVRNSNEAAAGKALHKLVKRYDKLLRKAERAADNGDRERTECLLAVASSLRLMIPTDMTR